MSPSVSRSGARARHAVLVSAVAVSLLLPTPGAASTEPSSGPSSESSGTTAETTTVERGTITQQTTWDATLTYGGASTLTWGGGAMMADAGAGDASVAGGSAIPSGGMPASGFAGAGAMGTGEITPGVPGTGTKPSGGDTDSGPTPGTGGGTTPGTPTPTPSATPTPAPTDSPTPTPTPSAEPSAEPSTEPTAGIETLSLPSGGGGGLATAVGIGPVSDQEASTDVVTWIADPASTVASGGELFRVNDEPVVLLEADVAIYRDLTIGDEGADVEAVETALSALGFDSDGDMAVDETYTAATADAVEAFQESIGADETGEIDPTMVVSNDSPVIVTEVVAAVGDTLSNGEEVMIVSDLDRVAEFSIDPSQRSSLDTGTALTVTLPDGSAAEATVTSIDAALQEDGTYGVIALLPDVDVKGDKWTVTVTSTADVASDALLVDPEALLVTDTLGTAVRVSRGGATELIPVTIVGTASQRTAIEADGLEDGDVLLY